MLGPKRVPEGAAQPPRIGRWTARAGVATWFFATLVAVTWPVVPNLGSRIVGHEMSGPWRTLWAHNWTLRRLQSDGVWPLTTTEISFPHEGPFSSIAPVNDLLSLPLQSLFGLIVAYNLVALFHLLLASTGGYALGRAAGLRRGGSLVAGTVFGFNAFLLTYGVSSAVVETSTQGWLAWFLAALLWLLRRPGPVSALAAGVTYALAGLSSFYWALMLAIVVPIVGAPALWDGLKAGPRAHKARTIGWLLVSAGVAAVVFWPPASALLETYQAQGAVLQDYASRKQELLQASVMANHVHDFATLNAYLETGKDALSVHKDMDRLAQSTYAGWIALVLASFGLGRGRWRWLAFAAAGCALSLGPFLFLTAESWRDTPVLWWLGLRDVLPPIRMITSYVRFCVFFYLGLAVLAGFAADRVTTWFAERDGADRPAALFAPVVLAGLVFAELAVLSPVPFPVPSAVAYVPESSQVLATLPKAGAVIDWPQRYAGEKVEVSRYFFYQAFHGRPIPYDFAPTSYMPGPIEMNPFFGQLERQTYGPDYVSDGWSSVTAMPTNRGLQDLLDMGYAYLVVHPWHIDPQRQGDVLGWLDSQLSRVSETPDGGVIYELSVRDGVGGTSSR